MIYARHYGPNNYTLAHGRPHQMISSRARRELRGLSPRDSSDRLPDRARSALSLLAQFAPRVVGATCPGRKNFLPRVAESRAEENGPRSCFFSLRSLNRPAGLLEKVFWDEWRRRSRSRLWDSHPFVSCGLGRILRGRGTIFYRNSVNQNVNGGQGM